MEEEEVTSAEINKTTIKETTKEATEDTTEEMTKETIEEATNGLTNSCRIKILKHPTWAATEVARKIKNVPRELKQLFKGLLGDDRELK